MSTYGQASQVVVAPFIASQAFRQALQAAVPCDAERLQAATGSSVAMEDLLRELEERSALPGPLPQVALHIGELQRNEVASAASSVLEGMGFQVSGGAGGATTSIWAERGHEVMAMEVANGGGFQSDHAGLAGEECLTTFAEFRTRMQQLGITWSQQQHLHNDRRGGQLIRRVSAATVSARGHGASAAAARGRSTTARPHG